MQRVDSSDYILLKKITAIRNANAAAESRKFRAPTNDVSRYSPYIIGQTCLGGAGIGNDSCRTDTKLHNTFVTTNLSCNVSPTTG